jgi:hypothetical protein
MPLKKTTPELDDVPDTPEQALFTLHPIEQAGVLTIGTVARLNHNFAVIQNAIVAIVQELQAIDVPIEPPPS